MNPSNPLFALVIILITFFTGYIINLKYKLKTPKFNRFETIDGLRGFLAICVFIHHSNIWYKYLHEGIWVAPDSNLYNQLGQTGVAFFFMISSFLFVKSLIDFKAEHYNWKSFFIKRYFRLTPLHFFITIAIILIVFIESNWMLNTSYKYLIKGILKWFSFGVFGLGEINNYKADIINAGVLWSLKYEWLLYFSLPLISLIILKSKPKILILAISVLFILLTINSHYQFEHIVSFLGGAIAPIIMKYNKNKINYNKWWFTLIIIISLIAIVQFHSSRNYLCKLLIIISFTLIALGNNILGLLKNTTLKLLGEISYSTYLLHGIIIFIVINYIYGLDKTKLLSETEYSMLIFIISPFVILISFLAYKFIEKPFIKKGKRVSSQIKKN